MQFLMTHELKGAAVQAMLDRLGDPATRVAHTASQPLADQGASSAKDVKDRRVHDTPRRVAQKIDAFA